MSTSCQEDRIADPITNSQPGQDLGQASFPTNFNFSTYHDITLDMSDAQMGVYRIYGLYEDERDLLTTVRAAGDRLLQGMHIPLHYTSIEVERYTRTEVSTNRFELTGGKRSFTFDYNTYRKNKTNTSGLPTNVLYAVNGDKDFFVIDLNDFSHTTMPDLTKGSIACAVDTVNDKMYYHSYPNMYEYDLNTNTHSVSNVNPNPFNGNYPRMEWDHNTGHMFISGNGNTIHEVNPVTGATIKTYTMQGIVNSA